MTLDKVATSIQWLVNLVPSGLLNKEVSSYPFYEYRCFVFAHKRSTICISIGNRRSALSSSSNLRSKTRAAASTCTFQLHAHFHNCCRLIVDAYAAKVAIYTFTIDAFLCAAPSQHSAIVVVVDVVGCCRCCVSRVQLFYACRAD